LAPDEVYSVDVLGSNEQGKYYTPSTGNKIKACEDLYNCLDVIHHCLVTVLLGTSHGWAVVWALGLEPSLKFAEMESTKVKELELG
jgi:hypothetical protein